MMPARLFIFAQYGAIAEASKLIIESCVKNVSNWNTGPCSLIILCCTALSGKQGNHVVGLYHFVSSQEGGASINFKALMLFKTKINIIIHITALFILNSKNLYPAHP